MLEKCISIHNYLYKLHDTSASQLIAIKPQDPWRFAPFCTGKTTVCFNMYLYGVNMRIESVKFTSM